MGVALFDDVQSSSVVETLSAEANHLQSRTFDVVIWKNTWEGHPFFSDGAEVRDFDAFSFLPRTF